MDKSKDSESTGPERLIYKKYGGNQLNDLVGEITHLNSPIAQGLIFFKLSENKWGPKLYGIFEHGRIEEYVDCHTLTGSEAFDPEMIRDIAMAYARYHSMDIPLARKQSQRVQGFAEQAKKHKPNFLTWLKTADKSLLSKYPLERLAAFPIEEEYNWIKSLESKISQRVVLCTLDTNYLNRLVKTERPKDHRLHDPKELRTFLIDHDLAAYCQRGHDLGGHFVERMYNWGGEESKVTGLKFPDESDRKYFIFCYLRELKKHFVDFDEKIDSAENITIECSLHSMSHTLMILTYFYKMFKPFSQMPGMFDCLPSLLKLYNDLKWEFREKYPQLA